MNSNADEQKVKGNQKGVACYTRRIDGAHVHLFKISHSTSEELFFVDDIIPPMPISLATQAGFELRDYAMVFDDQKEQPYMIQEAEYHRNYVHIDTSVSEVRQARKSQRGKMIDSLIALALLKVMKSIVDDEAEAEEEGINKNFVTSSESLEGLKPSIKVSIEKAITDNSNNPKAILIEAQVHRMSDGQEENNVQIRAIFMEAIEEALSQESVTRGVRYKTEMSVGKRTIFKLVPCVE